MIKKDLFIIMKIIVKKEADNITVTYQDYVSDEDDE